ncbi:DsrE family protein [Thioalkalivibrio sp. ALMg13-2]|uniref:DsrE family protein n=1 Tax=Thioalkalivibrio sp. ALMg13-2 TaxID=1158167 RepID=UPI00035DA327|nr:DsrE family protein [Thioalkalivibrio sp. ALMg13-2]
MKHSESPARNRRAPARPRPRLLAALACTALVGLGWNASATAFEPEAKVVYHVDYGDPQRLSSMLTSINNMMTHYQNEFMDVDVRVVFMSDGIRFATDDNLEETPFEVDAEFQEERDELRTRLSGLHQTHGVKYELCDITRTRVRLDASDVHGNVDLVPSGVVRLAELQNDKGFAYIKID